MIRQDEEWLTAEASLIPLTNRGLTRETYKSLQPSKEVTERAAEALQNLGFTIEAEGVISISISGRKDTFEKVFDIQFDKKCQEAIESDVKGTQSSYYSPISTPRIPHDLKNLVYDIVFPVPPTTFM